MATWIAHLRIAENLLAEIPGLDAGSFATGSIAPDSGVPDEKWEKFTPPPEVSHFATRPFSIQTWYQEQNDKVQALYGWPFSYLSQAEMDRFVAVTAQELSLAYHRLFGVHVDTAEWVSALQLPGR